MRTLLDRIRRFVFGTTEDDIKRVEKKVDQIADWIRCLNANKEELRWAHRTIRTADAILDELEKKGLWAQVGSHMKKHYNDTRSRGELRDV